MRVFFEPRIPPHDPELYAFERIDEGVAAAGSEAALARYRADGFLMVRGLVPADAVSAARAELEAMTQAERPGCSMIWYEGGLRDRLALDPGRDREIDGRVGGVGFAPGQEGDRLPELEPLARGNRRAQGFRLSSSTLPSSPTIWTATGPL